MLVDYPGSISVVDLLKRDLADSEKPEEVTINNLFGDKVFVPGKLSMRCAMKELMKSFSFSGYDYFVEVVVPGGSPISFEEEKPKITNNVDVSIESCSDVSSFGLRVLSMASPFRVFLGDSSVTYDFRLCIWKRRLTVV